MRTYGRTQNSDGSFTWVEVQTDPSGLNDYVWLLTLVQCLQLSPGESPFYSQYGIPAQQSIAGQIYPDYYVAYMQSLFAQYFLSLTISKTQNPASANPSNPTYNVRVLLNSGLTEEQSIPT